MGANSTLRAISEMMQISCDFSNSGSSGPGEEVKKENHQNLTPQMIGKSNSVQLRMFGRKRALIFTRKMVKNFIRLLWSVHRKNSPWTWPANGQTRLVLLRNDQNKIINQQNRNIISTISIFAKTRFFLRHPVSLFMFICVFVYLCICVFVCLSICVFVCLQSKCWTYLVLYLAR